MTADAVPVASRRRVLGTDSTIDSGSDGFRPVPTDQPQKGATLGELVRFFLAKPSPRIILTMAVGGVIARLVIGEWGWLDVAIPVGVVVLEPFIEWVIHVHVLHRKPSTLGRFTIDPVTARKHREHHRNPKDLRIVMVPMQALIPALVLSAVGVWLLDPPQAAMAVATGFSLLGWYEWVHYLIHAPYRPKTAWFRKLSRNHVLHHYKNEHLWFGVTNSVGDRVLRTRPDPSTVELSPTVRTLGVEAP